MVRTQIQLPDYLYKEVKRIAEERELSLAELARRGLEYVVSVSLPIRDSRKGKWTIPDSINLGGAPLVPEDIEGGIAQPVFEQGHIDHRVESQRTHFRVVIESLRQRLLTFCNKNVAIDEKRFCPWCERLVLSPFDRKVTGMRRVITLQQYLVFGIVAGGHIQLNAECPRPREQPSEGVHLPERSRSIGGIRHGIKQLGIQIGGQHH